VQRTNSAARIYHDRLWTSPLGSANDFNYLAEILSLQSLASPNFLQWSTSENHSVDRPKSDWRIRRCAGIGACLSTDDPRSIAMSVRVDISPSTVSGNMRRKVSMWSSTFVMRRSALMLMGGGM
jgi:hypothetical protein